MFICPSVHHHWHPADADWSCISY